MACFFHSSSSSILSFSMVLVWFGLIWFGLIWSLVFFSFFPFFRSLLSLLTLSILSFSAVFRTGLWVDLFSLVGYVVRKG